MNRILGQALTVGAVALGALTFTPACAENDTSIFVRHALSPPQNRANGLCVYTTDPTQGFISEGTLDFAVRDNYVVTLLVGSQLSPRGDQANLRTESNRVHLLGAVVKVTDPNQLSLGEFTTITSGFVDPGQNNAPSFGLAAITAIDAPTQQKISAGIAIGSTKLVIANIKVFGKTLGGVDVETGEFQYPIRLCNQCLLDFSKGDDPATVGKDCNLPIDGTGAATTGGGATIIPCNAGQDESTPCQTCKDRPACQGL